MDLFIHSSVEFNPVLVLHGKLKKCPSSTLTTQNIKRQKNRAKLKWHKKTHTLQRSFLKYQCTSKGISLNNGVKCSFPVANLFWSRNEAFTGLSAWHYLHSLWSQPCTQHCNADVFQQLILHLIFQLLWYCKPLWPIHSHLSVVIFLRVENFHYSKLWKSSRWK